MARSAHEKSLERARAKRARERAEQRHGLRLVLALLVVLVIGALALGAVLLTRGGGEDTGGDPAAFDADAEGATDATTDDSGSAATDGGAAAPCPASTLAAGDLPTPYAAQPTVDLAGVDQVRATLVTTCGDIVLTLDPVAAPATVNNFVALAEDGYYDGVGFHRVIDDFMIQGGDPTGSGNGCLDASCAERLPGYTFADELALAEQVVTDTGGYPRGTLAMANAGPDTNGSQFFIVQAEPGYGLPPAYAVFGQVESGMEVVDRIALGPVDEQLAIDPVRIISVEVER